MHPPARPLVPELDLQRFLRGKPVIRADSGLAADTLDSDGDGAAIGHDEGWEKATTATSKVRSGAGRELERINYKDELNSETCVKLRPDCMQFFGKFTELLPTNGSSLSDFI